MMNEMTDRRTIPGFPDYAIDRDGVVWRVTPAAKPVEARHGPSPRRLAVVWVGNGKRHKRYAAVTLTHPRSNPTWKTRSTKRTIDQLMRDVWPEVVR